MVNYGNGKIYKIQPTCDCEIGEVYYGSTTKKYLSQRMDEHRSKFKKRHINKSKYSVYKLFEKYGVDNCEIVLIELVNCNSKDELLSREKHYIKTNNCVNKVSPIRTVDEKKEYDKNYYDDNVDKIKEYYIIYREKNNEQIKLIKNEYYKQNKVAIRAKNDVICQCECGGCYTKCHKAHHYKTTKHQNFINKQIK